MHLPQVGMNPGHNIHRLYPGHPRAGAVLRSPAPSHHSRDGFWWQADRLSISQPKTLWHAAHLQLSQLVARSLPSEWEMYFTEHRRSVPRSGSRSSAGCAYLQREEKGQNWERNRHEAAG